VDLEVVGSRPTCRPTTLVQLTSRLASSMNMTRVLPIVSVCDQQVRGMTRARSDLPGEFVVSLVLFSLRALESRNVVVTDAWPIGGR
jgi:hypothetical protein